MPAKCFVCFITFFLALIIFTPVKADFSGSVTAPSLQGDKAVVDVTTQALLPPELYETPISTSSPVKIGVAQSFFTGLIQNLVCGIPLFGNFCPKDLNLVNGQTQEFISKSALLTQTERPPEIQPTALPSDPNLQDDASKGAVGNQAVNQIQTSMGTQQGVYSIDQPEFDDYKTECLQKSTGNLELQTKKFDQDLRVPDINCRQKAFYQANFPEGISPFENQIAGQ